MIYSRVETILSSDKINFSDELMITSVVEIILSRVEIILSHAETILSHAETILSRA
jgi:hypothetical protein